MRAMVAGGMHYIRSGDGGEELYALDSDPDERTNAAPLPDALAGVDGEVSLDAQERPTQRTVLDALEASYPTLRGTIRDHGTAKRRDSGNRTAITSTAIR